MTYLQQYNMFLNNSTHSLITMTEYCQICGCDGEVTNRYGVDVCETCHAPYIVGMAIGRAQMGDKGEDIQ